jgi:hypothetical protein
MNGNRANRSFTEIGSRDFSPTSGFASSNETMVTVAPSSHGREEETQQENLLEPV